MYSIYGRMFNFNNFEQVAQHYNVTKPIAGKFKHLNIIPVGDRKRKWERIEKISDDCYALYDAQLGDPICHNEDWKPSYFKGLTPEISLALAPIVWTRVKGGYTIRIRNGSGDYAHVSRYSFLNRAMPRGLEFVQTGQGRQYVKCDGVDYFLPKSKYECDYQVARSGDEYNQWEGVKDDHHYLTFYHDDLGDSASHSTGWKPYTNTFVFQHPKSRIDKEEKAKHKENTDKFWDWICAVAPLMPTNGGWDTPERKNYEAYNSRMADEANDYLNDVAVNYYSRSTSPLGGNGNNEHCAKIVKDMMADEEHPLRLPMAWAFVNTVNGGGYYNNEVNEFASVTNQEKASKLRAKYNRWINNQLNLVKHHESGKVLVSESLTKKEK